jgi:hypothetical protein
MRFTVRVGVRGVPLSKASLPPWKRSRVPVVGVRIDGLGFKIQGLRTRIPDFGTQVPGSVPVFQDPDSRLRVLGSRIWDLGSG